MDMTIVDSLLSKESIFALLFFYMLNKQMRHTESQSVENKFREEKLYSFLDDMKMEFSKLVKQYERISNDVEDIKGELKSHKGEK